jgi:2-oxoisovalerate dehydrogenase E1 component alpha subunit
MRHASKSVADRVRVPGGLANNGEFLSAERCLEILRIMVRSRVMEERMIKMSKSGEGYFWIGGPGEEAFHACLGLQVNKGQGPDYDYLLLKYRSGTAMMAMGMPMIDSVRQMAMRRTDPFSMGRNFASHFALKEWNVLPVSSVIGTQFAIAPGTALVQKRRTGSDGVTIVVGGEAGTAEGDFASCMIWSTRPGNELPVLMIVMNNGWGISTSRCTVDACEHVIDRGKAFGIPGEVVNGNDPIASWYAIERALQHCREKRAPYMLEANVSRLYGHSSSSGAPRSDDPDCIELFEERLLAAGIADESTLQKIHDDAKEEADAAVAEAMREPAPTADDVKRHTYAPSEVDKFYPNDYTGLPE